MRIMLKLLGVLVIVTLVPLTLMFALQERLIFPAPSLDRMPQFPADFSDVAVQSSDGETLFALYKPAPAGKPTIIVFHGNGDAAVFQHAKAEALSKAGFGVLLAEYRGYPGSTGSPSENGLYLDAAAVYDFVRTQTPEPIALYGHSLGAAVAIQLASVRDVYAAVLESPFDSLLAVAERHYPWVPAKNTLLKHKFRSDQFISNISAPLLIIHGAADQVIPIDHARKLLEHAPSSTRFREIMNAGHNDLTRHGSIQLAVEFFVEFAPSVVN